ncbi:GumC family protein [Mucilaginibacter glaciei]|uniref:Polysaccharide biosynthesis tyrosine autokinase n=1 Tax=Mucilaginibacter glaciei TaxID=2772109 RepID=A0A926S3X9_9SPHI|nr:polysaccharide biosynthesis tyrosine autokinase [Mucilaginibacter glaciei]MBD1395397.1 polysaccharide biosynthesis tyrosine autokinase [Mucilaginibacter glaciei]
MNNTDLLAEKLDFTYKKEESLGDFKNMLATCVNYWYVFVAGIIISLICAFFYIQYLPIQWNVLGKIIVDDDKTSTSKSLTSGLNSDLASLFDMKSNASNEVKVLKSRGLLKQVVVNLKSNIHIYQKRFIGKTELFDNSPFIAITSYKKEPVMTDRLVVRILNNSQYQLTDDEQDIQLKGDFGRPLTLPGYSLTLNKTPYFNIAKRDYLIKIESIKQSATDLENRLNVSIDDKQSTVINLQLSAGNPAGGEKTMQMLMKVYLQNNLSNKVRIADSTMKFIDTRLVVVGGELNRVEKNLEVYKKENKISDITAQSKALVEGATQYQNKLNDNEVQLAVANDLYKYVNNENNNQVIPSSLITKDIAFGSAINAYNEMLLHKEQLKLSLVEGSTYIQNLNQQIDLARQTLLTSLRNYRNSLQVSQSAFRKQNSLIEDKISNAPTKERLYLDYSRQQSLKQELYLFLLQKREETAISQTATISSCRILDDAESSDAPFAPKKSLIYSLALFAGLLAPAAGLSIKEMLNVRINSKADIIKHTDVPLLGEISRNPNKKKNLIYNDARSVIAEEIRALRTNLKYVTEKGKSNVILFTSSMSGEGKSFISLNLGNSIALSGKKVVLLELDLRKPRLLKNMGIVANYGFTNYVADGEGNIDSLIQPSTFNENFYFISSGPIPPNPAEILMGDHLKILIDELKTKFDYVIIDSAPVGLVSDALIIEDFADVTCYVVRQNYTYKSQLGIVNDLYKTKKAKRLYMVVNDIEIQKNSITGYGYGFDNYGYDNVPNPSKLTTAYNKLKVSLK